MKKKKIIIGVAVLGILVLAVGGYSLCHIVQNQKFLEKYTVSEEYMITPSNDASGRMETDDLSFGVFKARYYTYKGNLSINDDATGEYLIIWENIFTGDKRFGAAVFSDEGQNLCIDFDKNGVGETQMEHELLCEHKDEVDRLLELAKNEWGIDVEINTSPYNECK